MNTPKVLLAIDRAYILGHISPEQADRAYAAIASAIEAEGGDPQGLRAEHESAARSEAKGDAPDSRAEETHG